MKLYWKYLRFAFIYSNLVPLMLSLSSSIINCKEFFSPFLFQAKVWYVAWGVNGIGLRAVSKSEKGGERKH